ncbi:TPA: hypothetical protein U1383_001331 [Streptococcus suis]|uniref:Uncharacterized protein n=1 Tax=Streptococcus suis TaxID=1307 RepID=A0A116PTK2_STRSU|nr:hypothetical protein [Streptococcus suis]NQG30243.1 hypothetical protein [Streptococcus suis]CYW75687.1 Uncharacterised protein [Streptococcus suis]HEM5310593.1 hypothetical protein [Streptococcus suis]HEM5327443.1 hypothetical protein [Streptococcus suis]
MAKNTSLKKIEEELERVSKDTVDQSASNQWMRWVEFGLPLVLISAAILYLLIGKSTATRNQNNQVEDQVMESVSRTHTYLDEIEGAKSAKPFDWTVGKYDAVKIDAEVENSMTLAEFTQEYGLADSYEESTMNSDGSSVVTATYHSEDFGQDVTFWFNMSNGAYRIYQKSFYNLVDENYPEATDENFVFKWDQATIDALALDQSPEEIMEQYGLPTYARQNGMQDYRQLGMMYQEDNDPESTINSIHLVFMQNDQGEYRLKSKEGVFRD